MKNFLLLSLSATMALAVGSTAYAQTSRALNDTPNSKEHNPAGESRFEYRSNSLSTGVLSPDDSGPNNRAIPLPVPTSVRGNQANSSTGGMMTSPDDTSVGGIQSPDDSGPNNRATPGADSNGTMMQPMGGQQTSPSNMNVPNQDNIRPSNTIQSPDSQGPNNRAVPNGGSVAPNSNMMTPASGQQTSPSNTIQSPDSQGPNNRAVPNGGSVVPNSNMMTPASGQQTSPSNTIQSPNSQGPNNRAVPGADPVQGN
jgi:hypothetical protein